jgi:hypothetical protein
MPTPAPTSAATSPCRRWRPDIVASQAERDPNTSAPATYTGVYISDLFEAFGADKSTDVIGANCSDGRKQYYDRDYVAKHRPLLKFDGKRPADWPNSEHGSWLGPSHA